MYIDFPSLDTAFDRQRTGDIPYVLANLFRGDEPQVDFETHRPPRFSGRGDRYLPEAIHDVERFLISAQRSLRYDTLRLQNTKLEDLAHVLVEFAEDIRNDVGIWRSIEDYNLDLFGTRLPLVLEPNKDERQKGISQHRVRHLLWVLYSEVLPELIMSPAHQDLCLLADQVADFLRKRFASIPRESGVKAFLSEPNGFGWDVKTKLLWLGRHSYLLRHSFENYIKANGGTPAIPIIDDFVCQHATCWSGLGVIDILAATLPITKEERADLRSWYARHFAYFRVSRVTGSTMEVENIINGKVYLVRLREPAKEFQFDQVILGSLVPWRGEWYWSGKQSILNNVSEDLIRELRDDFLKKSPAIAYRYCDDLAEKARERVATHYREFVEYYGDDMVVYPDGLSMAADFQKRQRPRYESLPKEALANLIRKHNLPGASPRITLPPHLLEDSSGIGAYFNPEEGMEIMTGFHTIVEGFQKKGVNLIEDQETGIRSFISSASTSPGFVKKMIQRYGDQSIASAFLIRSHQDKSYVEYLLRRYKGHFYRKRYPHLSFV